MKITFKDGEENIPVIEGIRDWENSVFKNQYTLAQQIFNTLKKDEIARKYNNIVSFCGDRGTGKTSCMMSFKNQCEIENSDCYFLKEIDPSFFDDTQYYRILVSAKRHITVQESLCAKGFLYK